MLTTENAEKRLHRMNPAVSISLRQACWADVATLFEFQRDPAGNELAGTKPRDREAFEAVWRKMLAEPPRTPPLSPNPPPRVIIADGALVGSIGVFAEGEADGGDGAHSIGYWIAREHWGRGIATRAIALMLEESPHRPARCRPTWCRTTPPPAAPWNATGSS